MKKHLLIAGYLCVTSLIASSQPTVITLQPGPLDGKDAEIFSCVPCGYDVRNFGTNKDLDAIAWTNNGNNSNVRSLFQFDLSAIPAGATIVSALLSLYNNPTSDEGGHFSSAFTPNGSLIQRVVGNWDESTLNWNNQPPVTKINQVPLKRTTSSNQDLLNINVKPLVIDMINNPSTSFGFRLKLRTEHHFRKLILASSDNPNASIRPKLVITYSGPSPKIKGEASGLKVEQTINETISLNVFPNPVKDVLNISVQSGGNYSAAVNVCNIIGEEIFNLSLQITEGANKFSLQTGNWTKGIYFVRVKTANEVVTKKILVQ